MNFSTETAATGRRRYVLVAPAAAPIPDFFDKVEKDNTPYQHIIEGIQRLRGNVYLEDGAIADWQLSPEGRHIQAEDDRSWHLVVLGADTRVSACVRCTLHRSDVPPYDLNASNAALAHSELWRHRLHKALGTELHEARRRGVDYAEVGGWALSPELRCTTEALRMALTAYSLGQVLGGALGITTATTRHNSSSILRRIGGQPLTADGISLPAYYDPRYQCEMEILRFDSSRPNPRYTEWVRECTTQLASVQVLQGVESQVRGARSHNDRRASPALTGLMFPSLAYGA